MLGSYRAATNGVFFSGSSVRFADVTDGLSNTILYASVASFHPGGANFAFLDGSVHFIKESINNWQLDNSSPEPLPIGIAYGSYGEPLLGTSRPGVYQALSTRNVGEVLSSDSYLFVGRARTPPENSGLIAYA